jgi:large-conductance mechanosensitive channel
MHSCRVHVLVVAIGVVAVAAATAICAVVASSLLTLLLHRLTHQLWDYETGSFEQTLRGHTNTVQCLAFDATGDVLGVSAAGVW